MEDSHERVAGAKGFHRDDRIPPEVPNLEDQRRRLRTLMASAAAAISDADAKALRRTPRLRAASMKVRPIVIPVLLSRANPIQR